MARRRRDDAPSLWRSAAAAFVVFALGWLVSRLDVVRSFELKVLDVAFPLVGPPRPLDEAAEASGAPAESDVALILVDSGSLLAMQAFARAGDKYVPEPYPWQRVYYGAVVDFLYRSGARAVLLDFDFSGPSPYLGDSESTAAVLRQAPIAYLGLNLKKLPPLDEATVLAELDKKARAVCRRAAVEVDEAVRLPFDEDRFNSAQVPDAELAEPDASRRLGALNGARDPGEPVHDLPLLLRFDGVLVPSISLALASDVLGTQAIRVDRAGRLILEGSEPANTRTVPLDSQGHLLVHWYGSLEAFSHFPFHRTLKIALADYERRVPPPSGEEDPFAVRDEGEGEAQPTALYPNYFRWSEQFSEAEVEAHRALFRDKIVLIGVNAYELGDVYSNPFSASFPGVAIHATALLNLLRGDLLSRAPVVWRDALLFLLALCAGVGAAFAGGERRGLFVFLALVFLYPVAVLGVFHSELVWFDTVVPLGVISLSYGTAAYLHYRRTGRLKRQLRSTFEHVLQPALVDHLLSDPRRLVLGGESRPLTILFTDLQNSTALSESLPAEEWVERLNHYLSRGTGVVIRHLAYLDKFIGDGLMAVWGAPVPLANHEEEACRAVVELRRELGEVEEEILREHGVRLVTRIGLNSGEVIAGMVGSEGLSHYTVLGDAVVTASRLEGANKFFGTRTLIGERTWSRAGGVVEGREVDLVVLKGKSKAIKIYEPFGFAGELDDPSKLLADRYGAALEAFRARRWDDAIRMLENLLEAVPRDGPSQVLLERARAYRESGPPDDWRGELVLTSK